MNEFLEKLRQLKTELFKVEQEEEYTTSAEQKEGVLNRIILKQQEIIKHLEGEE